MINQTRTIRLVQWLSWMFATKKRKKGTTCSDQVPDLNPEPSELALDWHDASTGHKLLILPKISRSLLMSGVKTLAAALMYVVSPWRILPLRGGFGRDWVCVRACPYKDARCAMFWRQLGRSQFLTPSLVLLLWRPFLSVVPPEYDGVFEMLSEFALLCQTVGKTNVL